MKCPALRIMRNAIDTAPRNGDFIILEDARGAFAFVRWSHEAAQWLDEKGTPCHLTATHWHSLQNLDEEGTPTQLNAVYWPPLTPAQSLVKKADDAGSLMIPSKPSAWRILRGAARPASGGMTTQLQRAAKPERSVNVWARFVGFAGRGCGKILSAFAVVGGWIRRRRSIVAMAACLLVGAAFGPLLYSGDLGKSLLHWTASGDDIGLQQALQQERERASKLTGDVAAALREVESQTTLIRQAGEASSSEKAASERTLVDLRQALQLELANTDKLAEQLADAQRDNAAQTALTGKTIAERERVIGELRLALKQQEDKPAQANVRTADQLALKQEREKAEKLRVELAAARREAESQAAILRSASDETTRLKEASARATDELRQTRRQGQDKAEKLAGELAAARQEVEAQTTVARAASEEARQAAEKTKRGADDQGQALREAKGQAEKLTAELAAAREEVETQTAAARAARDEATRQAAETSKRSADDQGQALREAKGHAERLTAELAVAQKEIEAQTAVARVASDEVRRAAETSKQRTDEQGEALREAQSEAKKFETELAAARRELQSQVSVASAAKDEAAGVKEAAERSADEQRRALQQERDKTEKRAAELTEAKSSLEAQTKAKAADDVARDNQLATVRGELQKAKADATVALEALVAERTRTQRVEQQLASIQERTGPRDSRLPAAASSTVGQPSVVTPAAPEVPMKEPTGEIKLATNLATGPAAAPEQGSPQAIRLIARANLLLEQGNIGAARNMLDRAAEMGSTEALFWLAETYDPLLLSARKTFGTQSDIAKARELYGKALAGGVSQAKTRLEALQQ